MRERQDFKSHDQNRLTKETLEDEGWIEYLYNDRVLSVTVQGSGFFSPAGPRNLRRNPSDNWAEIPYPIIVGEVSERPVDRVATGRITTSAGISRAPCTGPLSTMS